MATESLDHRIIGLREYIERQANGSRRGSPAYAHPVDAWILRALEATPARETIEKAVDAIISIQLGELMVDSVPINAHSFPDLYRILAQCAATLDIPVPQAVTFNSPFLFNAFTAGTDEYSFIAITAGLTGMFKPEEAAFVIGHECGHIAARHMIYHTLAWVLSNAALVRLPLNIFVVYALRLPLFAWSRRSEVTADRAGLLCCGDIRVAERALVRLVTGLANIDDVDIDDYLRHYKEAQEFHGLGTYGQLFGSHPIIPKRVEALRLFAESEKYYRLSDKPIPEGAVLLSDDELDHRVQRIIQP